MNHFWLRIPGLWETVELLTNQLFEEIILLSRVIRACHIYFRFPREIRSNHPQLYVWAHTQQVFSSCDSSQKLNSSESSRITCEGFRIWDSFELWGLFPVCVDGKFPLQQKHTVLMKCPPTHTWSQMCAHKHTPWKPSRGPQAALTALPRAWRYTPLLLSLYHKQLDIRAKLRNIHISSLK